MALTPDDTALIAAEPTFPTAPVLSVPGALRCLVSRLEDRAIVEVRGDVDTNTAPDLTNALFAALTLRISALVVDLGYVSFADSSGIAVLVEARNRAAERGIALTLTSVPRQIRTVVALTGLSAEFGLSPAIEGSGYDLPAVD